MCQNNYFDTFLYLIIPWILEPATTLIIMAAPRLIHELWIYSRFTKIKTLTVNINSSVVTISLHKSGHCLFERNWNKDSNESGICSISQPCTFTEEHDIIKILSHTGTQRIVRNENGLYLVIEDNSEKYYNIKECMLTTK